jgi:hypothetical protein
MPINNSTEVALSPWAAHRVPLPAVAAPVYLYVASEHFTRGIDKFGLSAEAPEPDWRQ